MLAVRGADIAAVGRYYTLDFANLTGGELRRAPDGWHAIVPLGGANHRLWLKELPANGSPLAVELPLDFNFEIRAQAAYRFRRALEDGPLGPPVLPLTVQRRQRLTLSMRALDGWLEGNTYREIAAALFGATRISERDWRTHDLRNRTIRLVRSGFALMRGGYRALLRPGTRRR